MMAGMLGGWRSTYSTFVPGTTTCKCSCHGPMLKTEEQINAVVHGHKVVDLRPLAVGETKITYLSGTVMSARCQECLDWQAEAEEIGLFDD